jgi:large subunit ribosomal protein L19
VWFNKGKTLVEEGHNMQHALLESLEPKEHAGIPELRVGDTVRVHARIVEGNRERIQVFQGLVIRMRGKKSAGSSFTVRRIASHGVGVERTFLQHSPRVDKGEVLRSNKVRRAKLYYLRDLRGKAARLKEVNTQR